MNQSRILQLDGLRFIAVMMVIAAHWFQWKISNPIVAKLPLVNGVTLFFVLSGFLITRIILIHKAKMGKEISEKWHFIWAFIKRRALRIFPIFYVLIIFLFLIDFKETREFFPWLATYTINIYQSIHNIQLGDFNHLWSLAIEEQFYLIWPLLLMFVPTKRLPVLMISVIVISILTRAYLHFYVEQWMATGFFTLSCFHGLALGGLLAYYQLYKPENFLFFSNTKWLVVSSIIYGLALTAGSYFDVLWYKTILDKFLFAVVSTFAIACAFEGKFKGILKAFLENRFIVFTGKISYGIYLFHLFIPSLWKWILKQVGYENPHDLITAISYFLLLYGLSILSWNTIEKPMNSLKSKVPYLRSNRQTLKSK